MKKTIVYILDGVLVVTLIAFIVVAIVNISSNKKNEEALQALHMEQEAAEKQKKEEASKTDLQEENWELPSDQPAEETVSDENSVVTPEVIPADSENGEGASADSGVVTDPGNTDKTAQNNANVEKFEISGCFLPDSDTKEYTKEELEEKFKDCDVKDIKIALYEIYARYGCRFENIGDDGNTFQHYFDAKNGDGYQARGYQYNDFDESILNEVEKKNVEILEAMVKDHAK